MNFDIGRRLKHLRTFYKISQSQMAELADIDDKYYGRIERNESTPTISIIEKVCTGLDIPLVQFFMPSSKLLQTDFLNEYNVQKVQAMNMPNDIDIHYNRNILLKDCNNCLWYDGYIASAYCDELEIQLVAEGNIKAQVYINFEEVASFNDGSISNELSKYIKNDEELTSMMVREDYNEEILSERQGSVMFVPESNWLSFVIINHSNGEEIDRIELDTENIYEPFMKKCADLFYNYF